MWKCKNKDCKRKNLKQKDFMKRWDGFWETNCTECKNRKAKLKAREKAKAREMYSFI